MPEQRKPIRYTTPPDEETIRILQERGIPYEIVEPAPVQAPQTQYEDTYYQTPGQSYTEFPQTLPMSSFDQAGVQGYVNDWVAYMDAAQRGDVETARQYLDKVNAYRRSQGMPDYQPFLTDAQIYERSYLQGGENYTGTGYNPYAFDRLDPRTQQQFLTHPNSPYYTPPAEPNVVESWSPPAGGPEGAPSGGEPPSGAPSSGGNYTNSHLEPPPGAVLTADQWNWYLQQRTGQVQPAPEDYGLSGDSRHRQMTMEEYESIRRAADPGFVGFSGQPSGDGPPPSGGGPSGPPPSGGGPSGPPPGGGGPPGTPQGPSYPPSPTYPVTWPPGVGQTGQYTNPPMGQPRSNWPQLSPGVPVSGLPIEDRHYANQIAQNLFADTSEYITRQDWLADVYRGRTDLAFSPMEAGGGGYSPEEAAAILRDEELRNLQMTDAERQANYLTEAERGAIRGDPNALRGAFDRQYLEDIVQQGQDATRGVVGDYRQSLQGSLGDFASSLRGTVDPNRLRLSDLAMYNAQGALQSGEYNVRSYLDPERLNVSQEYLDRFQFTPDDERRMVELAAASEGQATQAQLNRIARAAAAQGQTSPLALAAAQDRARMTGALASGQARREAEVAAKQLGLGVAQQRESTRLGAAQGYAQLGTANEQELARRRLEQIMQQEQMRLGAEQGLSDRLRGVESELGQTRLGYERGLYESELDNEQRLAQQQQDMGRYIAGTQLENERYIEALKQSREAALAQQRLESERYNQEQRYARGFQTGEAASQRMGQIADRRWQAQKDYRDYLQGQLNQSQANVLSGRQQQIGTYATTGALQQGATQQAQYWKLAQEGKEGNNPPSSWEKILGGAIKAAGLFFGG